MATDTIDENAGVTALRDAVISGRLSDIEGHFMSAGAEAPFLSWNPRPSDLGDPRLSQLLDYWQGKLTQVGSVPVSAIDPVEMSFILGYVMILESMGNGEDFRYRLYGSMIADRFGHDVTGLSLKQIRTSSVDATYILDFILGAYQAVASVRAPLLTIHYPRAMSETAQWTRLILPLVDQQDRVSRLLVGQIPGAWRPGEAGGSGPGAIS